MYGEGDLAETELFKGGYCNFGFWDSIPSVISPEFRAETSTALYREVLTGRTALPAVGDRLVPHLCASCVACEIVEVFV